MTGDFQKSGFPEAGFIDGVSSVFLFHGHGFTPMLTLYL